MSSRVINSLKEVLAFMKSKELNQIVASQVLAPISVETLETTVNVVKKKLDVAIKNGKKPYTNYANFPVYQLGDDKHCWWAACDSGNNPLFMVRGKLVTQNKKQGYRCTFAYRVTGSSNEERNLLNGFGYFLFMQILFPKYETIFADITKTPDGVNFTEALVTLALHTGYYVYYQERINPPLRLVPIKSPEDYYNNYDNIWGTLKQHQLNFLIISKVAFSYPLSKPVFNPPVKRNTL